MKLLESYLLQIRRYLPYKDRDDTIKELRSIILDQVDEKKEMGLTEEGAIYNVILEMGEPRKVAKGYSDHRPFISDEMEPVLKLVLKIVSITTPLAILFADAIDYVFSTPSFTFMEFLLNVAYNIPSAMYALVVALGFVFVVFVLIERFFQPKFETEKIVFKPELLPEMPEKGFHVSLFGSIVAILVTVLALYILNFQQGIISIYYDGVREPLLNSNFDKILPFINVGWLASISLHVFYLYKRKKSIPSKTAEFAGSIYGAVLLIIIASSSVFNDIIIDGENLNVVANIVKIAFIVIGAAGIIGAIVEYAKMFININRLDAIEEKK